MIKNSKLGFTLVELLVVMAILAILATVSLANFRTSQIKARDAQRKADLRQIANALEAYMNDHGGYPTASSGKIKACECGKGTTECNWDEDTGQREFCDASNTVYMTKVPGDPLGPAQSYCYKSNGSYFQLYAKLENTKDQEAKLNVSCEGTTYNFGVSSSNCKPEETDPEGKCK
ncbi:MAG: type II secretion system protein [Patescibacteria group bacterium]